MTDVVTPHLELEINYIREKTPLFTDTLAAFLRDQDDPTGLRISTLRMMARSLKMSYEEIDSLLWILENRGKPTAERNQ